MWYLRLFLFDRSWRLLLGNLLVPDVLDLFALRLGFSRLFPLYQALRDFPECQCLSVQCGFLQ